MCMCMSCHVSRVAYCRSAFDRMVDIVACGRAFSRDCGDQGIVNSLAYGHGAFDNVTFLPFRYNAIHRVQMLRPSVWRRWDPAIVHIVGDRKPWSPAARLAAVTKCNRSKECPGNTPYFEQEREWLRACPAPPAANIARMPTTVLSRRGG